MSLFSGWFTSRPVKEDLKTIEKVELDPKIKITDEQRISLYEQAVQEVTRCRARELVKRELRIHCAKDHERAKQTFSAIDKYGLTAYDPITLPQVAQIRKEFPKVLFNDHPTYLCTYTGGVEIYASPSDSYVDYPYEGKFYVDIPSVTLDNFIDHLTDELIRE